MAANYFNQFLFYSDASEAETIKYIENFLLISNWGISIEDLSVQINTPTEVTPLDRKAIRIYLYKTPNNFLILTAEGLTLDRLKENLIHSIHQNPRISNHTLGFAVKNENLLLEFKNGSVSHQLDAATESANLIENHFQKLNLALNNATLKKVFTIHHHFTTIQLKNFSELVTWLKQKLAQAPDELIEIEGWGTLYSHQGHHELRWDLEFEPDWMTLSRWINKLVPAIDVFTDELKDEYMEIRKHFKTKPSLDLSLDNTTFIWKGQTFLSLSIYTN